MGQELEWKRALPDCEAAERILADPDVTRLALEQIRTYRMGSTYYDTPERTLGRGWITLRCRMENDRRVYCVKAPLPDGPKELHSEWETEAEDLAAALELLTRQGAPSELLALRGQLAPVCGAAFTRRAVLLGFADGSRAELALDLGELRGKKATQPLAELELEQKQGDFAQALALLAALSARYGLQGQEKSKYARASALD